MPEHRTILSLLSRIGLLLCLLPFSLPLSAQSGDSQRVSVNILSTEHRPPTLLQPELAALLGPGEQLAIVGEHFVVTATLATIREMRETLESLDQPLRDLQIRIDFGHGAAADSAADSDADTGQAPDAEDSTAWQVQHGRENDRILIEEDADDEDRLHLLLQVIERDGQLQLDYGISSSEDAVPRLEQRRQLLPGQTDSLFYQPPSPEPDSQTEPEAESETVTDEREIRIRIDLLN